MIRIRIHILIEGVDQKVMSSVEALLADRKGVRGGGMSSKFKGVSWDRKNLKWKAQICIDGTTI
jgi:hypothetical protein